MKRTLLLSLTLVSAALLAAPIIGGAVGETAFILAAVALPVLLMALGALRGGHLGALRWSLPLLAVMLAGCLLVMAALAGRVVDGPRLFGLPLAAVVQLVGLFGLPALLVALAYGLGFDRHGVRTEDLERLRALRPNGADAARTETSEAD